MTQNINGLMIILLWGLNDDQLPTAHLFHGAVFTMIQQYIILSQQKTTE